MRDIKRYRQNEERLWKRKGKLLFLENPVSGMREL